MSYAPDTIVACATPPGKGGVAIVRLSGEQAKIIAQKIISNGNKKASINLTPRQAHYTQFYNENAETIDLGLILFFPGPHSFTGEDVVELHCHGGPILVDQLLKRSIACGARLAEPGEFSLRAFLNDKIDLIQAEAIADLIDSSSEQAARSALHSLQGEFSKQINMLLTQLIELRKYVEAAIDFPDEEVDFLSDGKIESALRELLCTLTKTLQGVKQGVLLNEGMTVVITGKPNAGKSSLMNQLCEDDTAIVTNVPGTTRDVLREYIQLDGMPLHIIDTAGIRDTKDTVEAEGVRRARRAVEEADRILLMVDATESEEIVPEKVDKPVTVIRNKVDLTSDSPSCSVQNNKTVISLSAKTGAGLELLKQHLLDVAGYQSEGEGSFIARRRHLEALSQTKESLEKGLQCLVETQAGELLAEELKLAQESLGKITGNFTSDDLLGEIFSSFCIGK